uniref:AB hydrolase-1 domain-containing protein n=1 Tax=Neogobius melanostomus TaxID=47308 RepID=A0A8C6V267_9GOBI
MLTGSVLLLFPVVAFVASFVFWPGLLIKAYNWFWRRRLGMTVRFSHVGGAPSLLLLHGFSANKDMWLPVVQPSNLLKININSLDAGNNESLIRFKVFLCLQFVHSVGLKHFHLIGTSMGGNLAGVYAARFPQDLCSVSLVCPAGLEPPEDTEFVKRLREMEVQKQQNQDLSAESIALIPTTVPQLQDMLDLCCHKPLKLPRQMMKGLLQNRLPTTPSTDTVMFECISTEGSRHSLQENLGHITVPVQVVWGQQDQVLHVSGASVIAAALPHSQVALLDDCGHSVALERPRKLASVICSFLSTQEVTNGDVEKKKSC